MSRSRAAEGTWLVAIWVGIGRPNTVHVCDLIRRIEFADPGLELGELSAFVPIIQMAPWRQ